ASSLELSRVVERRPGVMPPRPGPPPRDVARRRILVRRFSALGALALVGLVVLGIVKLAAGGSSTSTTTTVPKVVAAPKPFRIVFPEGFTRSDMAQRVSVVAKIAERERHKPVRLSRRAYLAAVAPRRIPGFGSKKRRLEGFLFPATYDFLKNTTSAQLVRK